MLPMEKYQMTRASRPVGRPLQSRDTGVPSSTLRGAKKKLTATFTKAEIESTHSKQTTSENSNRNKNGVSECGTKATADSSSAGKCLCRNDNVGHRQRQKQEQLQDAGRMPAVRKARQRHSKGNRPHPRGNGPARWLRHQDGLLRCGAQRKFSLGLKTRGRSHIMPAFAIRLDAKPH
jgi:hypothetical protein